MINEIRSTIVSLQFKIARLTTHLQRLILKIPWNVHKLGRKEKRSKMKGLEQQENLGPAAGHTYNHLVILITSWPGRQSFTAADRGHRGGSIQDCC